MMSLRFHWVCLLLLSLCLLLWYSHVTRSWVSMKVGLRGYVRVLPNSRSSSYFLDFHCGRCAVVSSSGQMLASGQGQEIDKQECVIRMNVAPTVGYEADVGNMTSLRVISHTSVPHLVRQQGYFFGREADTRYVVWGPEKNMRQDGKGKIFNALVKLARKYPQTHIYTVTREKIQYCDAVFQNETGKNRMQSGAFLSTGFFTMILALEMCDSILVYGMIDGSYCSHANHSFVPYHYYEPSRLDECRMYRVHEHAKRGGHRFITEKVIYSRWALQGKLWFVYPSWSPQQHQDQ
ncbi:alpha-N-acetyl-neuraminyl-2,3-beta-galactosyl-1,3-N-acetyl-galactosaminide alpha-2,6-sialyltransferase isoform X2 [Myxocyprinus asiaticus]|uniref:alpha-N-acetyl-neuraminyl-2,3-beta-galactosyl-1, 3-N-acetyl-galactosaminide alpha-2,6-sialyltransferase isoform X2 n=1 Tax=Myxocyprinus asiaticus TaxID=70543 RepID=UPI002222D41C|nr:alpha-N-acetyl-neuraminyl-2,3-beta-galactosyl-1,3-N-acetyl-galactosaminide alpha-2,6-sialyltransferase isoform X2 [Myxocyprinus asiaticus]